MADVTGIFHLTASSLSRGDKLWFFKFCEILLTTQENIEMYLQHIGNRTVWQADGDQHSATLFWTIDMNHWAPLQCACSDRNGSICIRNVRNANLSQSQCEGCNE